MALGLEEENMLLNTVFYEATTNQNVNQYVSMGLTLSAAELSMLNLCDGGFTMFAPSSELDDTAIAAIIDNADTPLFDILAHHVYAGESFNAADLSDGMELTMMDGNSVTVSIGDNVMIDDATVVMTDIVCSNGVIHIIDDLLFAETSSLGENKNIEYSVFPNPSNGAINISSSNNSSYNVKITNYLGDLVFEFLKYYHDLKKLPKNSLYLTVNSCC
jgi:uncharacterized surface protein with fasciclin (FAS1) repeats